jgi:hypothetical protein
MRLFTRLTRFAGFTGLSIMRRFAVGARRALPLPAPANAPVAVETWHAPSLQYRGGDGLEVASPLIARSSQCAVRNDDRAGVMRRLEKNPKDFLKFVKIDYVELTFRLKLKNSCHSCNSWIKKAWIKKW